MRIDKEQIRILAGLGVLIAGFVFAYCVPQARSAGQKRAEIARLEGELRTAASIAAQTSGGGDAQENATARQINIDDALPASSELGSLLERLSADLAAEAVQVQQLEARSIVSGHGFHRIPMSLRFKGPYSALVGLLNRIESARRIYRIDELHVRGGSMEADPALVVDIQLSAFFRAEEGKGP